MKNKEYFYGKYILRDGDLLPEEINEQSCNSHKWNGDFLNYLDEKHLLFSSKEEAMAVHDRMLDVSRHCYMHNKTIKRV